jgi:hypothetical protein
VSERTERRKEDGNTPVFDTMLTSTRRGTLMEVLLQMSKSVRRGWNVNVNVVQIVQAKE